MTANKRNLRSSKAKPQLRSRNTRSRGKPLSDPASNTQQLNSQLLALGLYAAPTIGDGNCLFRALSDQLYGTDAFHHKVRKDVCDWIESNKERYEPFVEDERGIDTHLRCMRENATYGGHMELSAFAHLTRRNVKVIQPGLVYVIEWDAGWDPAPLPDPPSSPVRSSAPQSPGTEERRPKRDKKRISDKDIDQYITSATTVYVAYHDWEHFSSIRNLRGPHVGAPMVQEMPADASPPPSPVSAKPKSKPKSKKPSSCTTAPPLSTASTATTESTSATPEASSSSAPSASLPRIKLRLSRPTPSSSLSSLSSLASSYAPDVADPAQVPLPTSRSPTPSEASSSSLSLPLKPQSHSQTPPSSIPEYVLHRDISPSPTALPHHHRSPKRTFDESSVSSSCSSTTSSKRTKISNNTTPRSKTQSTPKQGRDEEDGVQQHEMDVDVESMSTPSLSNSSSSASSSSSPSLSSSTSSSAASSPEPSPPPPPPQSVVAKKEKPLTRRQRKALGLPKKGNGSGSGSSMSSPSAGKIIIPGGRFRARTADADDVDGDAGAVGEGEQGEWRTNGSGRVDVRGFRELKI